MDSNTAELIQKLAGTFNKDIVEIIACNVDSVDEANFTCDCTAITGDADTTILAVRLNAESNDGYLIVPAVDSTILVASSTRNNYYVFMFSDIQKLVCVIDGNNSFEFSSNGFIWNDGTNGGIAKTASVAQQLNALENKINALLAAFGSWVVSPGDGGAALKALVSVPPISTPLNNTTQAQISNDQIQH